MPDGALLIRDGTIAEVGTSRRVENLAAARQAVEINAAGRVVMPGFVDSHTHLLFPPPRAAPSDDADAVRLLHSTAAYRMEARAREYLEAMARHGTTTVEVKTGCGLDGGGEWKLLRSAATLKGGPIEVVSTFLLRLKGGGGTGPDTAVREFLPRIKRRRLAEFADIAWDCDAGRHDACAAYLSAARRLGFGRKVHADADCVRPAVVAAIQQFASSIDHLEHASPDVARLLGGCPTVATLTPATSFLGGGPDAPARALIEAGAAVALATNFNSHHTPLLSMQMAIGLARLRLGMTVAEAIIAATINGAYALECGDRVGSIELGKQADLLILDAPDYRDLAHQFGRNLVQVTIKRGEVIYREGIVTPKLDPDAPLES